MFKKTTILILFCCLIASVQQVNANTTVAFSDLGGPDAYTFSFDVGYSDPWTFTLLDTGSGGAVPILWSSVFSGGRSESSAVLEIVPTNNIAFFTILGNPLGPSGVIGSFDITVDSLSNFMLFGDNNQAFTTYWSYNDSTDTYTISNAAVPIPPTVLLLGCGLVGLVGVRRRVKS